MKSLGKDSPEQRKNIEQWVENHLVDGKIFWNEKKDEFGIIAEIEFSPSPGSTADSEVFIDDQGMLTLGGAGEYGRTTGAFIALDTLVNASSHYKPI